MVSKEILIDNNGENAERFESRSIFVSINDNSNKQYLFSIGTDRSIVELFDLDKEKYIFKNSTTLFLGNLIYSYIFSLIELEPNEEQKEYLLVYTYDKKYKLQKFSFSSFSLDLEIYSSSGPINVSFDNRLVSSFIIDYFSPTIIVVFYVDSSNNDSDFSYNINIYDFALNYKGYSFIDSINDFNEGIFSKSFHLKDNFVIFIYYKGLATSSLTINIGTISNGYSFQTKLTTYLNEYYFRTEVRLNEFIKVNDERFIFFAFDQTTLTNMTILLIDLFNGYNNIKIREYNIYLKGMEAQLDISADIYNGLLVFSSTVRHIGINDIFSIFMIFGYVNGTDELIDISEYFMDNNINNENNLIINLTQNIEIENNIFGYEVLSNQIKLVSIPNELLFYNKNDDNEILVNNGSILYQNYIIKENEYIVKNSGYYYLEYQIVIQEPDYDTFNSYSKKIINGSTSFYNDVDQRNYFTQKQFFGRTNTIKFKLCHSSCSTCNKFIISIDNQQCFVCLEESQYDYPNNNSSYCVPEGYFYNKIENRLILCNSTNSKFYFNLTNNKRICFDINLNCPDEYPYLNETNNECHKISLAPPGNSE